MLCEGLALLLIEKGILPRQGVVEAIEGVVEAKREIAGVSEDVAISMTSIGLLLGVARGIAAAPIPGPMPGSTPVP